MSIPNVPNNLDPQTRLFLEKIKEAVEVRAGLRGDALDRVPTLRELFEAGVLDLEYKGRPVGRAAMGPRLGDFVLVPPGKEYTPYEDYRTPAPPSGLTISAAVTNLLLRWSGSDQRNVSHTEVWRGDVNDLDQAVFVGVSAGGLYADPVGPSSGYYYWIRFRSYTGIYSAWASLSGVWGETDDDPSGILELLDGAIRAGQLHQDLGSRIDLIDTPGTGLVDGLAQEVSDRIAAVSAEAAARVQGLLDEAAARGTAISDEATLREAGDTALAQTVSTLSASVDSSVGSLTAAIQDEATARIDGDGALASDLSALGTTVTTEVGRIDAAIVTESTARADGDSALASDLSALGASVDTEVNRIDAAIVAESTARADGDSALASRADLLEATVNNPTTGVNASAAALSALTTTVGQQGEDISAHTSELNQIQAIVGSDYSALQEIKEVTVDPGGLSAQWMVKTDVNGHVSGVGLWNDGIGSEFLIRADRFGVTAPGATTYSLVVEDGRVVMDGAAIKKLSVTDASIASLNVDKITGATADFVSANILDGSITNAKIGDTIQSDNYVPGVSGWIIKK